MRCAGVRFEVSGVSFEVSRLRYQDDGWELNSLIIYLNNHPIV
jgi:hypothetical protein